jgi:hypothetical protein
MTQQMPVVRERFPSTAFLKRWIGPACAIALGVGSLTGAIIYRSNVPVVTTTGQNITSTATVTETATAPPVTAVETRTATVTVTGPPPPPQVREVTVTKTAPPETVQVEKPTRRETETVTETQTVQEAIRNIGRGRGGE